MKEWTERIFQKKISALFESLLLCIRKRAILFLEITMEINNHAIYESRYASISFARENGPIIFLPARQSLLARSNSFIISERNCGSIENVTSRLRTNSFRYAFTIALSGKPSSYAAFWALFFVSVSALMLISVFIYLMYI